MMDYSTSDYRKYSLCEHISTFIILFATSSLTYTITNDINNKTPGASGGKISCTDYLYTQYEIENASNEYENHVFNSCHSHRFKYERIFKSYLRLYSYILLSNNINTSCLCQYNALDWVTNNIIDIGLSPSIYLWNALNAEIKVVKEYYSQTSDIYSQYITIGTSDNIITLYVSKIFKPLRTYGDSSRVGSLSCGSADSMFIYLYDFNKNGIVYSIGTHYSTWTFEGSCYGAISVSELFYSHFRILQTDFNSNRHYYLAYLYSYVLSNNALDCGIGLSPSIYLYDSSISADSNGHEQEVRELKCNDNINAKYLASDSNDNKCYICDFRNLLETGGGSGDRKICVYNSTPSLWIINFKFRTISKNHCQSVLIHK